jgi:hypothetical protein
MKVGYQWSVPLHSQLNEAALIRLSYKKESNDETRIE